MSNIQRRLLVAIAASLAASILITGCSSTAGSSAPSGSHSTGAAAGTSQHAASSAVTACMLVTEQDASAALGADPGPGTAAAQSGVSACTYGTAPRMVSVHLSPAGKAEYNQMHAAPIDGATMVDLDGIGTAAFGAFVPPVASIA
ncbi:MAG TPA: hypothetical protein VK537_06010, partial [Galbitalea sp.]|nr:hypothetical protein [Galbitalea sp.]